MITDPKRLLEWLPEQRWFGYKGRALAGVEIVDEAILDDGPPALVLALVAISFEGTVLLFQLPLLVEEDGGSRDVSADPERLRLIGELLTNGDSIKGSAGVFQFSGPGLDPLAAPPGRDSIRIMGAEQSNTSCVLDEQVIFKFFRRVDVGPNPDVELNRLLTSAGFGHVPAHVGEVTYEGTIDGEEVSIDLGVAQRFLPDAVDAWEDILTRLSALYDEVDPADASEDQRFLTEERAGPMLQEIEELGDVCASMHIALARDESDPSGGPEAMDRDDATELVENIEASLEASSNLGDLRHRIRDRLTILDELDDLGGKTRVHGDLHLGQVMTSSRGWMILDFEGEPLRSLEERRAKRSPLKDVAGMLRSFSYVATAALFERAEPASETWSGLEPWAMCWETLARERFLQGYLTRAHEGRFLPARRESLVALLSAFEIEKAVYELAYEEGHRPDWVRIPLHGIRRSLEATDR